MDPRKSFASNFRAGDVMRFITATTSSITSQRLACSLLFLLALINSKCVWASIADHSIVEKQRAFLKPSNQRHDSRRLFSVRSRQPHRKHRQSAAMASVSQVHQEAPLPPLKAPQGTITQSKQTQTSPFSNDDDDAIRWQIILQNSLPSLSFRLLHYSASTAAGTDGPVDFRTGFYRLLSRWSSTFDRRSPQPAAVKFHLCNQDNYDCIPVQETASGLTNSRRKHKCWVFSADGLMEDAMNAVRIAPGRLYYLVASIDSSASLPSAQTDYHFSPPFQLKWSDKYHAWFMEFSLP